MNMLDSFSYRLEMVVCVCQLAPAARTQSSRWIVLEGTREEAMLLVSTP